MSENLTTKEHFALFVEEAKRHIKEFGLLDWAITFKHEAFAALAECRTQGVNKSAVLCLATDWEDEPVTTYMIRKCAYHEVCELLLVELGTVHFWHLNDDAERKNFIDARTHAVIRRLENRYFNEEEEAVASALIGGKSLAAIRFDKAAGAVAQAIKEENNV